MRNNICATPIAEIKRLLMTTIQEVFLGVGCWLAACAILGTALGVLSRRSDRLGLQGHPHLRLLVGHRQAGIHAGHGAPQPASQETAS
jgi:hypothetical protein